MDYISFCDEVESIFTTKQLEKMPTAHVTQYVIPNELEGNVLSQEEDTRVNRAVGKMVEVVSSLPSLPHPPPTPNCHTPSNCLMCVQKVCVCVCVCVVCVCVCVCGVLSVWCVVCVIMWTIPLGEETGTDRGMFTLWSLCIVP